jgi:hypothetical protein
MHNISLNTTSGPVASVPTTAETIRRVLYWAGIARNRATWSADPFAYSELAQQIREEFELLEISESVLRAVAEATLVEISTAPEDTELGFGGAGAPWEYLLASATWEIRNGNPLTVVRHLATQAAPQSDDSGTPLIVISGPGAIGEYYSFESEAHLIRATFKERVHWLRNPTLDELRQEVLRIAPDVIHLTGADIHQGAALLHLPADQWRMTDEGVYLADWSRNPVPVLATELAGALTAATRKPRMVGFNFYNAASIAARTVAAGARSAVAFHGTFDDRLAETFFSRFYDALPATGRPQEVFKEVWNTIRSESREVIGSGLVLWGRDSIAPVASQPEPPQPRRRKRAPFPPPVETSAPLVSALPAAPVASAEAEELELSPEPCEMTVVARTAVNYSLLHNRRGLFTKFEYRKHVAETLDLLVEVKLIVGKDDYPFTRRFTLDKPADDLGKDIYIPLTWISSLRLRESVLTNVEVTLTLNHGKKNEKEILNRPYQVMLLPPDEWTDDDVNRQWLPSFVLPRDPAISKVIKTAEELLPALADHRDAGFDGYQSIGRDAEDPYGAVDTQVQSIWAALSLHMQLRYVNPPPTFTSASQRVRTPSQIISGSRGTCIDLALLIASCLEFVDVYPVLFLLKGHAFCGYWRSDLLNRDFRKNTPTAENSPDKSVWMYPSTAYAHVMAQIRSGALVPLEATLLTQRGGFGDAIEEGFMNLRNSDEFEALLDISLARQEGVRPLPLAEFA